MRLGPVPLLLVLLAGPAAASAPGPAMTADGALGRLAEGNARFRRGEPAHPDQGAARRADTAAKGQRPFAIVLSCADSRVPAEVLFDQGIGDLFVIRVAGNVSGTDEVASIEYAAEHLGAPLCVVMGHSGCGAVKAAVEGGHLGGSLPELVREIAPAVASVRRARPELSGSALLAAAVEANVWQSIATLFRRSPIVRELAASGRVRVVGAVYDLATGEVRWLGPHPDQARLLHETSP